ncbi:SBE2 [Candida pseudojiufengensis]|uniref:SBE2 n=1 Tax=Candida pseudojiufengensis TaxID=497109 RepID=UPI0022259A80|nr:SBE2 [Candida pseudojiufengensis]KAI5965883.1 SBE2 [Candida pseudojiufengensis]
MSNVSINSQNLYDISLNSRKLSQPIIPTTNSSTINQKPCLPPKRVASMTSLPTLNEYGHSNSTIKQSKRPGDYYIQKINSKSSLNLNKSIQPPSTPISSLPNPLTQQQQQFPRRRMSQDSLMSLQSSLSDDHSSILSSQFDTPVLGSSSQNTNTNQMDTRHSSMTSSSTTNFDPNSSSTIDNDSTISLKNYSPNNSFIKPRPLKSASTTSVLMSTKKNQHNFTIPQPPLKTTRSKSVAAIPTLNRSKSKFLSYQESKERSILRKKKYEENDDDEEILSNDLDNLIFNVPMIKNHNVIYKSSPYQNTSRSSSNSNNSSNSNLTILSRNDLLVGDGSDKYNIRPCPLPGKLSTTNLPTLNTQKDDSILEEEEEEPQNSSFNDDSEIIQNISQFYTKRSESNSKLMKLSRETNLMYKLPSFIKSQSSLEDLHLISPEKLNFLDQTRPINLPPKSSIDKSKHNKEFNKNLNNFESHLKNQQDSRSRNFQQYLILRQSWLKELSLLMELDNKNFNKKLTNDKNHLRKLIWDCNVPTVNDLNFNFLIKVLSNNYSSQDSIHTIKNSFELFNKKLDSITGVMKQNKDIEFNKILDNILTKPILSARKNFDIEKFKLNFINLLYIKSISETGLNEKDYILITILLVIFPQISKLNIYILLELINQEIFNRDILNSKFQSSKFDNNDQITINEFLKIILQFNDNLPLSLSAPNTPIVDQNSSFRNSTTTTSNSSSSSRSSSQISLSLEEENIESSTSEIIIKLLTLLIINSQSLKTKNKNNLKLIKSFLKTIFSQFHINWNNKSDLLVGNKSIRINFCSDQFLNLEKFINRWSNDYFN